MTGKPGRKFPRLTRRILRSPRPFFTKCTMVSVTVRVRRFPQEPFSSKQKMNAKISAVGCFAPAQVLTNDDLSKIVDTNHTWIVERTGITERHIADVNVATSDMAVAAAREVL